MPQDTKHFDSNVVVMSPAFDATALAMTPKLFEKLDENFNQFQGHVLISVFTFESDWATWEVHPNGDEVVVLLEGDIEMALQTDGQERLLRLNEPGSFAIIPKNTWHTGRPAKTTKMLFITPGEGTVNAEQPEL